MLSIDADPEFFHGLTLWCGGRPDCPECDGVGHLGDGTECPLCGGTGKEDSSDRLRLSAQIRGDGGSSVPDEVRAGTSLALSFGPATQYSTEFGRPAILPAEDARRLRDLLNVATARGYL